MTHDHKLFVTNRDAGKLITKLGTHFKVKKEKLREEYEEIGIDGIFFSDTLKSERLFDRSFYVGHIDHLHLDNFIKIKRFKKSSLYSEYLNGKGLASAVGGDYCMIFYLHDDIYVVYESDAYLGIGGFFTMDPEDDLGFVVEPLAHYLSYNWAPSIDE